MAGYIAQIRSEDSVWGFLETATVWGFVEVALNLRIHRQRISPLVWALVEEELSSGWLLYFSDFSALTPLSVCRFLLLRSIRILVTVIFLYIVQTRPCLRHVLFGLIKSWVANSKAKKNTRGKNSGKKLRNLGLSQRNLEKVGCTLWRRGNKSRGRM